MRRIADALLALQQHGSGDYIGWEMNCPCNLPNVVDQLQQVASKLENNLEQWKCEIQEQRDEFYELNYYTTQQLLLLRKELGRLQEPGENTVKPEAMALLLSISRDVSGDVMKEYVLNVTQKEQQKALVLASTIAQAEDHVSSTGQPTEQSAQPEPVDPTISAVVIDLLESEATKTSTPRAIQQEDDLGVEQKAILANIRNNFGCHKQLILLAFEQCENSCDLHAVTAWCMDNQSKYTYDDDDDDDDDDEEEEEEEEDPLTETSDNSSKYDDNMKEDTESGMEVEASINEPAEEMVTVEERIAVDERHPVVKELLELDYPLEQCMQAAKRYPDDSQAAFEYLNELIGKQSTVNLFSGDVNSSRTSVDMEIPSHISRYVHLFANPCHVQLYKKIRYLSVAEKKLKIIRSQTKEYLTLLELGAVLNNMSSDLPSKYIPCSINSHYSVCVCV